MLSEKGSLRETPAVKLLLTIFEQGLTGILYIKREDILKVLYFSRGKVIWAISNSDVDKLENILLARGLVDPVTIKKIKTQSRVSDSIGKLLVEQGLITLEELIESTKEQLKRIILSILKWKDGGFQFIKDAPPERLLSLDLEVTQFVVDFIVEDVELSEIWKEIGSLQVEFIKNPDEQKLEKYHLSDKQKELLNSFDGEKKLEAILSRHASGHRESLLKIVYFFLMAELLIKKAFELSDLSVFEAHKGFDVFEPDVRVDKAIEPDGPAVPARIAEPAVPLESTAPERDEQPAAPEKNTGEDDYADDSYTFTEDSEAGIEAALENRLRGSNHLPVGDEGEVMPFTIPGEKKPVKRFNVILIMVFLILVIGGVIFLLLPLLENTDNLKDVLKDADKRGVKDIIILEEKPPPVPAEDNIKTAETLPETETGGPGAKKAEETKDKKNEEIKTGTIPKPQDQKPTGQDQKSDSGSKAPPSLLPGKSAKAYFLEGSLITAGDVWKKELIKAGVKYGILLEMDCLKESVMHAYDRMESKEPFFILNRKIGSKTCFLVMWGKFSSETEATGAIKSVPAYFWQQKDPPEVVELSPYL